MRRIVRCSAALVLLVPLASCGPAAPRKHFLWKVSSASAHAWLLGSIHVARPELYPLAPEIEAAFAASRVLVVEADQGKADAARMKKLVERGYYQEGEARATEPVRTAARELAAKAGLPAAEAELMKPWFLAIQASMQHLQKLGYDPRHGIDRHFMNASRLAGKEIRELESSEFQIELLSSLGEELQALFVASTLEELDGAGPKMDRIFEAWKQGDVATLETLVVTEGLAKQPAMAPLKAKLLDDRNVGMAEKVAGYLKTGEVHFVVMGSAHLLGASGVADLLRKKGFKVEQIESRP